MFDSNRYVEIRKKIQEAKDRALEEAKVLFQDMSQDVFNRYPDMSSFGWVQYTPYFNDGDPCYFSAHTDSYAIRINEDWMESDEWDENEEARGAKVLPEPEEISAMLSVFDDSDLESMFGDHVEIQVTRGGVNVYGYSHD